MRGKLYKTPGDKMLLGVCGGLAEYFDMDSTIVRILFVVMSIITGVFAGILVYVVLAIIMPDKPIGAEQGQDSSNNSGANFQKERGDSKKADTAMLAGFVFIAIGIMIYAKKFMPYVNIPFDIIVPAVFIGIGIYMVLRNRGDEDGL